jgi:transposase-like protein
MARGQRDPERERFWRDALRRHKGSGLTVRAFCAGEQLAETAFHAWRRILRERDAERRPTPAPAPAPAPTFVPVVVREADRPEPAAAAAGIAVELRGGRVMRLPASMPAEQVARLVRAIEGAA